MKKVICIAIGVVLGFAVGFLAASGVSELHDRYLATQGDLTTPATLAFIGIWLVFTVGGGWLGHRLYQRQQRTPGLF